MNRFNILDFTRKFLLNSKCQRITNRRYTNKSHRQDPNEVDNMPVYQFVGENPNNRKMVFTWGYSATGALGNEIYLPKYKKGGVFDSPKKTVRKSPLKLRFVTADTTVHDVAAGFGFTVIAATVRDTPYVLFGCGLNTDSQIGLQTSISKQELICVANLVPISVPVSPKEKIVKVSCGRSHTVCLTNTNRVLSFGNNSFGQCGRRAIENEKYFASGKIHEIKLNSDDEVVDIVCGLDHTLFLTKSGHVYACGWGTDGQLGNGTFNSSDVPTKVIGDIEKEKIVALSSAADCVLALNDKGQVFGWGNNEYSQFGLISANTQLNISKNLNFNSQVGKIVSVASSGSMCAAVNEVGNVFVWGYGLLGLGPSVKEAKYPTPIEQNLFQSTFTSKKSKITHVEAGVHHFGAINDNGDLFVWGKNNKANLGTGNEADITFPYRISIPCLVKKISFGLDHTVAIGRTTI